MTLEPGDIVSFGGEPWRVESVSESCALIRPLAQMTVRLRTYDGRVVSFPKRRAALAISANSELPKVAVPA